MSEEHRESIIPEAEFGAIASVRLGSLTRLIVFLKTRPTGDWHKRHYTKLVDVAHEAETFLDDYGARNNRRFSYLTELIACIRGLGKVVITLKHIESRFARYRAQFPDADRAEFLAETGASDRVLTSAIERLASGVIDELQGLSIPILSDPLADDAISAAGPRTVLPHNIDGEDVENEEQKIAEVAVRYIAVAERLAAVAARRLTGVEALKAHVLKHLDEEKSRTFESQVHSVQSKYDTFIRATGLESKTPALIRLRGHASLALHLLEMSTELVHFYVRHENDVRYELAKHRVSSIIDKTIVLDRIVNYASYYAQLVLTRGKQFAEEVLKLFVTTKEVELPIPDAYSLHARPISLIVRIVAHYGTPVEAILEGETCNAGSIMEMILAIGNRPSARRIGFRGDSRSLADIRTLFENGLGERGISELPAQLDYLKG